MSLDRFVRYLSKNKTLLGVGLFAQDSLVLLDDAPWRCSLELLGVGFFAQDSLVLSALPLL